MVNRLAALQLAVARGGKSSTLWSLGRKWGAGSAVQLCYVANGGANRLASAATVSGTPLTKTRRLDSRSDTFNLRWGKAEVHLSGSWVSCERLRQVCSLSAGRYSKCGVFRRVVLTDTGAVAPGPASFSLLTFWLLLFGGPDRLTYIQLPD